MQTVSTQKPAGADSTSQLGNIVSEITSNATGVPADINLSEIVERNAHRDVKGEHRGFRSRAMLNNSKLFSACCSEVKSRLGMEVTARLDNSMADSIQAAIDSYVQSAIMVNFRRDQLVSYNKSPKHLHSKSDVVLEHRLVAHETMELQDKVFCIKMLQGEQERRLTTLLQKFPSDHDYVKNCKASIQRHMETHAMLLKQQEELAKLTGGTKTA